LLFHLTFHSFSARVYASSVNKIGYRLEGRGLLSAEALTTFRMVLEMKDSYSIATKVSLSGGKSTWRVKSSCHS
jgi:hypothetical protein